MIDQWRIPPRVVKIPLRTNRTSLLVNALSCCIQSNVVQVKTLALVFPTHSSSGLFVPAPHRHSGHCSIGTVLSLCVLRRQCTERKGKSLCVQTTLIHFAPETLWFVVAEEVFSQVF